MDLFITNILLTLLLLSKFYELFGYLLLRKRRPTASAGTSGSRPLRMIPDKPKTKTHKVRVFDSGGNLVFSRPTGHPDLQNLGNLHAEEVNIGS